MTPRSARLTRGVAVAITGVALTLGAVACNDDNSSTSSPATSAAAGGSGSSATAGAASTAAGGAKGGAGSTASGAAAKASDRCHTADLRADVQLQPSGAGTAMVMLVNKGARTCTVDGYLGYGGLLADNSRLAVSTARTPYPGPPVRVTLKPGTTAFSGLKWSLCDKSDTSCKVLAGVVVTPPDETTQLTAQVLGLDGKPVPQLLVSSAGFTVGSLQPSNEGVLLP
ncbi:hypothetical protein P3T36_001137 [Kitasatospora sp. MAP12-15]|uniref:DUF4232 domain-containing protein n=1 Tax=unclassified Kitasatospora TaxID=2633591 RepID=UPI00247635C2|nr:DUF4232 domain-containing protein [Kitasatospora sp. MAP12-44]MDH6114786.1 hypothetical protein [Kitasatospora sp. MAP12-44]